MDPVSIRDITQELACLALWGPKARFGSAETNKDDISNEALPYLHAR